MSVIITLGLLSLLTSIVTNDAATFGYIGQDNWTGCRRPRRDIDTKRHPLFQLAKLCLSVYMVLMICLSVGLLCLLCTFLAESTAYRSSRSVQTTGAPRFDISNHQLITLFNYGFRSASTSQIFGVSSRTVKRRLRYTVNYEFPHITFVYRT